MSLAISASGSMSLKYVAKGLPAGLKINPGTGVITGTLVAGTSKSGPYTVTVVANDGTDSAAQTFAWTVKNPIAITTLADQTGEEGDAVSLSLSSTYTGGGSVSFGATGLPAGLSIDPSSGDITGTLETGAAAPGTYYVTILTADGTSSASMSFTWEVSNPIWISIPSEQMSLDGDAVSLSISASGPGTLTYAAIGLPAGLSINPATGVISGTVAPGNSNLGWFSPTIIVSNGTYSSSAYFWWQVDSSISVSNPGAQGNTTGDTVTLQIAATGSGLTYTASGLPTGLSIDTNSGLISGTIGSGAASIGLFVTAVTVCDGTSTASTTFTWTVSAAGSLTLATPSNQSDTEGDSVSLSLSASGSGIISYFAVGLPPGLVIDPSTGGITGNIAVGDAALSSYSILVVATNGTDNVQETFTWSVSNPITISAVSSQSSSESGSVSLSISASGGGTLVYTAVGLPLGLTINTSTGAVSGTAAIGAATIGTYTVLVTVTDGANSTSQVVTWGVMGQISLTITGEQDNLEGDTISLSMSASGGGTIRYSAFGLPPGLAINPTSGAVTGTIAGAASDTESYTATVTASDGTYSSSQIFTWNVGNPIAIKDSTTQVFQANDTVSMQIDATNLQSGTLSYSAFDLPAGLSINPSTGLISGTINSSIAATGIFLGTVVVTNGFSISTLSLPLKVLASGFTLTNIVVANLQQQDKLTCVPVTKPIEGHFGAFAWPIRWELENPAQKGGVRSTKSHDQVESDLG